MRLSEDSGGMGGWTFVKLGGSGRLLSLNTLED